MVAKHNPRFLPAAASDEFEMQLHNPYWACCVLDNVVLASVLAITFLRSQGEPLAMSILAGARCADTSTVR